MTAFFAVLAFSATCSLASLACERGYDKAAAVVSSFFANAAVLAAALAPLALVIAAVFS